MRKVDSRLPNLSGHVCRSMGNDSRCMGQLAFTVNLHPSRARINEAINIGDMRRSLFRWRIEIW